MGLRLTFTMGVYRHPHCTKKNVGPNPAEYLLCDLGHNISKVQPSPLKNGAGNSPFRRELMWELVEVMH